MTRRNHCLCVSCAGRSRSFPFARVRVGRRSKTGKKFWSARIFAELKACFRETLSPSRASKTYAHNAFQIIHIHTTVINSGHAHTGLWLRLQSWLMSQSPHRLRNDVNVSSHSSGTLNLAQSNPICCEVHSGVVSLLWFGILKGRPGENKLMQGLETELSVC